MIDNDDKEEDCGLSRCAKVLESGVGLFLAVEIENGRNCQGTQREECRGETGNLDNLEMISNPGSHRQIY